jgi:hypothetical protein
MRAQRARRYSWQGLILQSSSGGYILLSIVNDKLLLNNEKEDEFVEIVECAKKIYGEKEVEDTLNRK